MARRPDELADWFVGGPGKRPLLRLLVDADPERAYLQHELGDDCGLPGRGSVSRHLRVLEQAGLVQRVGARGPYRLVPSSPLIEPLREWLKFLEKMEQEEEGWRGPLPLSKGPRQRAPGPPEAASEEA